MAAAVEVTESIRPESIISSQCNSSTMSKMADLLKELKDMRTSVEKVENIVERRLIGIEEPMKDEVMASKEYDRLRKNGAAKYVPLKEAMKSLGVRRPSRKASR